MKKILLPILAFTFLISCSDDDPAAPTFTPGQYQTGIFVTNEGPFANGSGSITYISDDYNTVEQNIYKNVNGTDLGNIVQSMGFEGDNAFIVVNNSSKIMVANRRTFQSVDSITSGLVNPRYFASINATKAYVTDWGDPNVNTDDYIAVLDLREYTVSAKIPVALGPEKLITYNNKIYVAHQGAYGQNNILSIISGNALEKTITVGDVPNSMVVVDNSLFVLCGGNPSFTGTETAGSLVKIDLTTGQVTQTYSFGTTEHPSSLTMDGKNLYYTLNGKVYKLNIDAIALPGTGIIDGFYYTLQAKDGKLYGTDAGDYVSKGTLKIFDLSTNQPIKDFQTGIIPGGIYFNE